MLRIVGGRQPRTGVVKLAQAMSDVERLWKLCEGDGPELALLSRKLDEYQRRATRRLARGYMRQAIIAAAHCAVVDAACMIEEAG
jgi:hypothetical protein